MLNRTIASVLCLILAWTTVFPAYAASPISPPNLDEQALRLQYPHARVVHVSPEEYPALEQTLLREGYRPSTMHQVNDTLRLTQNHEQQTSPLSTSTQESEPALEPAEVDECSERGENGGNGEDSFRTALDITNDMMSGDSGNDEGAAVLFIIIGTVVLVIWTLYVVRFLFDVSFGMKPCGRWSELIMSSSAITSNANQHARFNGLRYITGFNDSGTDVGISAELGNSDILLTEVGSLRLQGLYWLIGPMLRWNMNPQGTPGYFTMEFVAGSTEHPEMGIIAVAKMGFNFGSADHFRWGVNFGAMNINLHANQGIISDLSQYYFLYGLEFGYRF